MGRVDLLSSRRGQRRSGFPAGRWRARACLAPPRFLFRPERLERSGLCRHVRGDLRGLLAEQSAEDAVRVGQRERLRTRTDTGAIHTPLSDGNASEYRKDTPPPCGGQRGASCRSPQLRETDLCRFTPISTRDGSISEKEANSPLPAGKDGTKWRHRRSSVCGAGRPHISGMSEATHHRASAR